MLGCVDHPVTPELERPVPDTRSHRGPHPQDEQLFAAAQWPDLRKATSDLSWLFERGYAGASALKLVGDRYSLKQRQRTAVARCACSDAARQRRATKLLAPQDLTGKELWIDGYNVLTTLESALGGGIVLAAHDGCYRDMASMHGSYRKVAETLPALTLLGETLSSWHLTRVHWLLDSPVSNSGRLKTIIRDISQQRGWEWTVKLAINPDAVLSVCEHVVASADSEILDRCERWVNLARLIVTEHVPEATVVDLSS